MKVPVQMVLGVICFLSFMIGVTSCIDGIGAVKLALSGDEALSLNIIIKPLVSFLVFGLCLDLIGTANSATETTTSESEGMSK